MITTEKNQNELMVCRKVSLTAPFYWIKNGLKDLVEMPIISLFYGICFSLCALIIMWLISWQSSYLVILPSLVVFVLIGPFLALGLYHASKERSEGREASLLDSMFSFRINMQSQGLFAVFLCLAMIAWLRLATIIHAIYPTVEGASFESYIPFLAIGSGVGLVMGLIVFSMSAFSISMMLDKEDSNVITAILSSMEAFKVNFGVMMIWGFLIVTFVFVGMITNGYGMIIAMPILGHATWHSYKDVMRS